MRYTCTIFDASRLAGVNESTIRRWLSEGRLVGYGRRKPWRVELGEVERLRDTLRRNTPE